MTPGTAPPAWLSMVLVAVLVSILWCGTILLLWFGKAVPEFLVQLDTLGGATVLAHGGFLVLGQGTQTALAHIWNIVDRLGPGTVTTTTGAGKRSEE